MIVIGICEAGFRGHTPIQIHRLGFGGRSHLEEDAGRVEEQVDPKCQVCPAELHAGIFVARCKEDALL